MEARALRLLGTAFTAICLLAGPVLASPVNIDTFDLGSAPVAISTGAAVIGAEAIVNPPVTQTIGGVRGYTVAGLGGGTGVSTLWVASGQAGLGTLTMASTYNGQWTLSYGYSLAGTPSDLNADLVNNNGSPNTGLLIKMVSAEYDYNLDLAVTGNGVSQTVNLVLPANASPHDVFVPFSSFSGVDFHDIDQINLRWTGQPNGDYVVDAITASVPEPATLTLLAASGLLLGLRRRR